MGIASTVRVVEVHAGREVVVDFDPTLTFECVDECTWCCHRGVLLSETDLRALAEQEDAAASTTDIDGGTKIGREDKDHEEPVDVDGRACCFLDDGFCALEADNDWKPVRCSVFPLTVSVEEGGLTGETAGTSTSRFVTTRGEIARASTSPSGASSTTSTPSCRRCRGTWTTPIPDGACDGQTETVSRRSGDEPPTRLFKCMDCVNRWREYCHSLTDIQVGIGEFLAFYPSHCVNRKSSIGGP